MALNISYTASANYDTISFRGEITVTSMIPMTSELNKYPNNESQKDLVLDLSEVESIDSSGLRLIIDLENKIKGSKKKLYILKPSEVVQKILRETNMQKVLTIIDSVETLEQQKNQAHT